MKEPLFYRFIAKPLIVILIRVFYRPKVIGIEKIPKTGRIILAGNHTNNLDSVMISAINKRVVHFLAKDSLLKGLKGLIFRHMAIIPVNRKVHDKDALNKAIEALNEEKVIGIFPEGTTNKTNNLILPFKIGAVKMASVTDTKIIPFVISGKYKLFNNKLCIEFLDSIEVSKKEDLTEDNEKLMQIISEKIKEKRK